LARDVGSHPTKKMVSTPTGWGRRTGEDGAGGSSEEYRRRGREDAGFNIFSAPVPTKEHKGCRRGARSDRQIKGTTQKIKG